MKNFKMPEVGNHIFLKKKGIPSFSEEFILTKLGDDEYCAVSLTNGQTVQLDGDVLCSPSVSELLGELQKYCEIYLMEN